VSTPTTRARCSGADTPPHDCGHGGLSVSWSATPRRIVPHWSMRIGRSMRGNTDAASSRPLSGAGRMAPPTRPSGTAAAARALERSQVEAFGKARSGRHQRHPGGARPELARRGPAAVTRVTRGSDGSGSSRGCRSVPSSTSGAGLACSCRPAAGRSSRRRRRECGGRGARRLRSRPKGAASPGR
jgi:hypothetical protein